MKRKVGNFVASEKRGLLILKCRNRKQSRRGRLMINAIVGCEVSIIRSMPLTSFSRCRKIPTKTLSYGLGVPVLYLVLWLCSVVV
jgi:hypothetical protein